MSIIPVFIALQSEYTFRKHRKLRQCEDCKYYNGIDKKCKNGRVPEFDWKYCSENHG